MYEVIVLGATFAAAGIASRLKEKCLVIEGRGNGGYEFFGGGSFAADEDFSVYPFFKECHTVFCAEICSVESCAEGFVCETHGVDGFFSYKGKRVIDTRATADISEAKTYDMLIESAKTPSFKSAVCKKVKGENRFVVELSVPLFCSFGEARLRASELVKGFLPTQRLILLADEFSYTVKPDYTKEADGILRLPSKSVKTPKLAFLAGEEAAK